MLVSMSGEKREGFLPVDNTLPGSIVHAVEEVKEHRTNVALGSPIPALETCDFRVHILTGVPPLPGVPTTPNNDREDEKADQGCPSTNSTTDALRIKQRAHDTSGHDLRKPVQEAVQGLGARVEVGAVDRVLLVCVEPVGGPEHGEQEDDPRLRADCLPQADDLGLPRGVLHQDDARAVGTHNLVCVTDEQSKTGACKHEYDKGDVGTVADSLV